MNLGEESFCNKLVKVRRTANDFGNLMKTDKNIRQKKATGNQRLSGFDSLYDVFHDTKNAKYKEKISTALMKLGKAVFHRAILGNDVKVKAGRNVSNRHVATSRLATAFKIQDMVCDSRNAYIRKDGRLIKGVVMENSMGEGGSELCLKASNEKKKIKYSENAISQLFTMQMFDALCGQIDRNGSNFHFTYKLEGDTYVLTGVKCIDNDMSFGLFVDIKKGFNRSKPVDERNIRGLPTEMLNRFMAMTPEYMNSVLGDILEKDELNALAERLAIIKDVITNMVNKGELEMHNGMYRYKDAEMRDDTLRQLYVIKEYNDEAEAEARKGKKKLNALGRPMDTLESFTAFRDDVVKGHIRGNKNTVINEMINNRKKILRGYGFP